MARIPEFKGASRSHPNFSKLTPDPSGIQEIAENSSRSRFHLNPLPIPVYKGPMKIVKMHEITAKSSVRIIGARLRLFHRRDMFEAISSILIGYKGFLFWALIGLDWQTSSWVCPYYERLLYNDICPKMSRLSAVSETLISFIERTLEFYIIQASWSRFWRRNCKNPEIN